MSEYTERAKVTDALIDKTSIVGSELEDAVNAICAILPADVRPVVRGKWLFHMFTANLCGYECRVCHTIWDVPTNFCPNCGADMREESIS